MQPFQQRVIDEKVDLDTRINRLNVFMRTDIFSRLERAEQDLLRRQAGVMSLYAAVLSERIKAFVS